MTADALFSMLIYWGSTLFVLGVSAYAWVRFRSWGMGLLALRQIFGILFSLPGLLGMMTSVSVMSALSRLSNLLSAGLLCAAVVVLFAELRHLHED